MGKRKPRYKVKLTGEIVIPCGYNLTIEQGIGSEITDTYELLDQDGMPTGKTKEFPPEELEVLQ
jgi:hypothetical protein